MLPILKNFISSFRPTNNNRPSPTNRFRNRVTLQVESLEGRWVPATLIWNAQNENQTELVSDRTNWIDESTNMEAALPPADTDTLKFNATSQLEATFDIDEIANLIIERQFGNGKIKISSTVETLTITGTLNFDADDRPTTIYGENTIIISTLALSGTTDTSTWSGGLLKNLALDVGSETNDDVSLYITGHYAKLLEDVQFNNFGDVTIDNYGTWGQPVGGTILLHDSRIENKDGGNIYFETDVTLQDAPQAEDISNIVNNENGHVQKLFGTNNLVIEAHFTNYGLFEVHQGGVDFGSSYSFSQMDTLARTRLYGGSSITASLYTLSAGYLEGDGTIYGNLAVDAASISPGTTTTTGTLTVTGWVTMSANSTLSILIDANGNHGTLVVQGGAALVGVLDVRNDDYAPNQVGHEVAFLTYANATGDFDSIQYEDESWTVNNTEYRFDELKQASQYILRVTQVQPVGATGEL